MFFLVKSTSSKVHVNNFKHTAGLGTKFFDHFNFCRILLRHNPASSVLGVGYQPRLAVVDIPTAVFNGLGKREEAGGVFSPNASTIVLIYRVCFHRNTYGRKHTHCFHRKPTAPSLTRCHEGLRQ